MRNKGSRAAWARTFGAFTLGLLTSFAVRPSNKLAPVVHRQGQPAINAAVQSINQNASDANDAPFRDGLFLGRIHAEAGKEPQPSVGRWGVDPANRKSFIAGYEQGYRLARQDQAAQ